MHLLVDNVGNSFSSILIYCCFANLRFSFFCVVDLVGGLGSSLSSTLSAADLGLGAGGVSNSFGSALSNSGGGSGGGYLTGNNSFGNSSGIR